ncbi:MAG: M64 family metallopeptidase [Pseudomonadota bacterium]
MLEPLRLHKAALRDAFNILLLCDGFTEGNRTKFYNFCYTLIVNFFKIPPFSVCKNQINFFAHFTASEDDGIPAENAGNTYYKTYFETPEKKIFQCEGTDMVFEEIKRLQIHADGVKRGPLKGSDIWMNHRSKSYGAIGIVAKSDANAGTAFNDFEPAPFFIFTMRGYKNEDKYWYPQEGGFQHIFVHELSHNIRTYTELPSGYLSSYKVGLADEYENEGEYYRIYPEDKEEPIEPNVTSLRALSGGNGSIKIENLKWRRLTSDKELNGIRNNNQDAIISHPNPTKKNSEIYIRKDATFPPGVRGYNPHDVLLVEGGKYYRQNIYRPNISCRMRVTYDDGLPYGPIEIRGRQYYKKQSPDFCRVCKNHILRAISGRKDFSLEDVPMEKVPKLIAEHKLMQRLVKSHEKSIDLDSGVYEGLALYQTLHRRCAKSSARMAIMLDQIGIPFHRLGVGITNRQTHFHLRYGYIIIDPTIFQFYLNIDDNSRWTYRKDGVERDIPFYKNRENEEIYFSKGFVGSLDDIKDLFWLYRPMASEWVTKSTHEDLISEFLHLDEWIDPHWDSCIFRINSKDDYKLSIPPDVSILESYNVTTFELELNSFKKYKELLRKPVTEQTWKIGDKEKWSREEMDENNSSIKEMYDPLNLDFPF